MSHRSYTLGRGWGLAAAIVLISCAAADSEPVRVVGSSTIFPFAAKAAEVYSDRTGVAVVVEQTGSGGGHKLFCSGDRSIDATTSSRRQKPSETALCQSNGVTDLVELPLGHDGIVLARSAQDSASAPSALSVAQLFRALARDLPTSDADCTPVANDHARWSDVAAHLPDVPITVYGPPPTSGTRDAFVETAMEAGARSYACLAAMEERAPARFALRAQTVREDGAWIDAGENDAALVRTLDRAPDALGVFGFSFLGTSGGVVTGVAINGVTPSAETIRTRDYPVVRDLYLYIHGDGRAALLDYARAFVSDEAAGPDGYLAEIGLVPLQRDARRAVQDRIRAQTVTDADIDTGEP